jgi:Domain of unknown function (DUF2017)
MSEFTRSGGIYSLDLSIDEAHILINLVEQLLELLGEGDFNHHYDESDPFAQLMAQLKAAPDEIAPPEDPVLLRLLPNAYADPEAAADFRRYTEPTLRGKKQRTLVQVRAALAIIVDEDRGGVIEDLEGEIWLMAINDLRLALSVRLEINPDSFDHFESLHDEDPQKAIYAVYFWLGWLQESLLNLLAGG